MISWHHHRLIGGIPFLCLQHLFYHIFANNARELPEFIPKTKKPPQSRKHAIAAADFPRYRSTEKSVCQTRLLNALYQEFLEEGIEDHEREDDHEPAGVADRRIIEILTRIIGFERRRYLPDQIDQHIGGFRREEQARVEVIRPLPAEGEQEDRNEHGDRQRKNDPPEGFERTRTVDVGGFFQFIRNSAEELTEQENVEPVLESESAEREEDHRNIGVAEVDPVFGDFHGNPIFGDQLTTFFHKVFEKLNFIRFDNIELFKE